MIYFNLWLKRPFLLLTFSRNYFFNHQQGGGGDEEHAHEVPLGSGGGGEGPGYGELGTVGEDPIVVNPGVGLSEGCVHRGRLDLPPRIGLVALAQCLLALAHDVLYLWGVKCINCVYYCDNIDTSFGPS